MKEAPLKAKLTRLFSLVRGIAFVVLGLIGRSPAFNPVALWRRLIAIAGGAFFLYRGSMYYWPKYRRMREERDCSAIKKAGLLARPFTQEEE